MLFNAFINRQNGAHMISVIVPVFNCEQYIGKCIESIINQDEKNMELIIINDGSVDGTLEICNRWKEKDCRIVLINQENQGQGSARNFGIKKARGEYLVFVDADDYLEPQALSLLAEQIQHNDYDILIYSFYYINRNNTQEKIACKRKIDFSTKSDIMIDSTTFLWDKMFKRTFFVENTKLENYYGEDLCACAYLLAKTDKIGFIEDYLYNHIERNGNLTSDNNKVMEIVDSLHCMVDLFKKQNMLKEYHYVLLYLSCQQYNLYRLELKDRFDTKFHKELIKKFLKYFKTAFDLDADFTKWLEIENKRRYVIIGDDLLPIFRKWRDGGIWSKYRNIENYMIDPYMIQRENEINPSMSEYFLSFTRELEAVKYGTLSQNIWMRRWKNQCNKFVETLKQSSFTGNIIVIKQYLNNEKLNFLLNLCYEYFAEQCNNAIIVDNIKTRVDLLTFISKNKPCYHYFNGYEKARSGDLEEMYLRGEAFRTNINLNIMNMMLKIISSKRRFTEYFQSLKIHSIAVYGMGYLGERFVEVLVEEGFDIKFAIDKNIDYSARIRIIKPEEDFDVTDAIIVTPVHLLNEIKASLEIKVSCRIISLEEVVEYFANLEK